MRLSVEALIKNRIIEHSPGWCFTVVNFLDLGKEASICTYQDIERVLIIPNAPSSA